MKSTATKSNGNNGNGLIEAPVLDKGRRGSKAKGSKAAKGKVDRAKAPETPKPEETGAEKLERLYGDILERGSRLTDKNGSLAPADDHALASSFALWNRANYGEAPLDSETRKGSKVAWESFRLLWWSVNPKQTATVAGMEATAHRVGTVKYNARFDRDGSLALDVSQSMTFKRNGTLTERESALRTAIARLDAEKKSAK